MQNSGYFTKSNQWVPITETSVFHPYFGFCTAFQFSNVTDFQEFFATHKNINLTAYIHDEEDLPGFSTTRIHFNDKDDEGLLHQLYVTKKTNNRESLQRAPCGPKNVFTCKDLAFHALFQDLNCKADILFSGQHLKWNQSLPDCSNQDISEALEKRVSIQEQACPNIPQCQVNTYDIMVYRYKIEGEFLYSGLFVTLQSIFVEQKVSSLAYDFQSLIGEAGGTLGLFLGGLFNIFSQFCPFFDLPLI